MMRRSKRMSILIVSKIIEFWEMIVDDVKDFWQFRDETAALVGMWEHMKLKWARKKSQILGELDKSANKFSEKISSLPYHQPSNGDSLKILPNNSRFFLHWCNANLRAQDINTNAPKQNTHKKSLKKMLVYLFPSSAQAQYLTLAYSSDWNQFSRGGQNTAKLSNSQGMVIIGQIATSVSTSC